MWSYKSKLLVLMVVLVGFGAVCLRAEEGLLEYRTGWQAAHRRFMRAKSLELSSERPEGVDLPEFEGGRQLYAKWQTPMAAAGYLWIAIDKSVENDFLDIPTYLRLFIDSDGDGHLKGEDGYSDEGGLRFNSVGVLFGDKDEPIVYHLNFEFGQRNGEPCLYAFCDGWYEGAVTIGDEEVWFVLIDYNVNGAFNDKAVNLNFEECDLMVISTEGEENIELVGKYVKIGEKIYLLEIGHGGSKIKLAEATDIAFGKVILPEETIEFTAGGENGSFTVYPENGVVEIPAGKYQMNHWTIEREDDEGVVWGLEGVGFTDKGIFDVNESGETEVEIGEPIIFEAHLTERVSGCTFSNPRLKGCFNESIRIRRNGTRAPQPGMVIKNKDGTYEQRFSFAYG